MAFVDYQNIDNATRALDNMNGYRFEHLPQHPGLLVDYDKDDTDNKVARYTIKRKREEGSVFLSWVVHTPVVGTRAVDGMPDYP